MLTTTLLSAKNPVNAFKDLQKGKKEEAFKSFEEISKKDSNSVIVNYAFAMLYSDSTFSQYDLELSYKYAKKSANLIDCTSPQDATQNCTWNKQMPKSELGDLERLKLQPTQILLLKDSIVEFAYKNACNLNTIESLKQFIANHPCETMQVNMAKKGIEMLAFRLASKSNTIDSYREFILKYPNSLQYEDAHKILIELAFNETKHNNTIEGYEEFINTFPKSMQLEEVKELLLESKLRQIKYHFLIKPKYDKIDEFNSGIAVVKLNKKYGYIDKTGKEITPIIYDVASSSSDGNSFTSADGAYDCEKNRTVIGDGAIKGNVIYEDYENTMFEVEMNESKFHIDKFGKEYKRFKEILLPYNYEQINYLQGGLICILVNGKYGLINKNGDKLTEFKYDNNIYFRDGYAIVEQISKTNCETMTKGYINETGKEITPIIYDECLEFYGGLAAVKKNGLWGLIDKIGQFVLPLKFMDMLIINEGLVAVKQYYNTGWHWDFIDKAGKVINSFQFEDIAFSSEGLVGFRKDGKWGYINTTGEIVIKNQFDNVNNFKYGIAEVVLNGKQGYLTKTGEFFDNIRDANKQTSLNLMRVVKDNKFGFIDRTGKLVIPYQYEQSLLFQDGLVAVKQDGKWGYMNETGIIVIPCQYEKTYTYKGGLVQIEQNGKWGCIDKTGKIAIPFQFEMIDINEEGIIKVELDNKWGIIVKN